MTTDTSSSPDTTASEELPEKPPVTQYQFYFETPLYTPIYNEQLTEALYEGEIDAYSAAYETDTTYTIDESAVAERYYPEFNGISRVTLKNKRKENDKLIFFVKEFDDGFIKLGQLPSLASLQSAGVSKKYRKQLSKKHYKSFTKAIGLAANGVGAGSLVYLRRIFSDLIDETFEKHIDSLGLTERHYRNLRMDERVTALRQFLPKQLVEMKVAHGILSSGIHTLEEEECLTLFGPLKLSIELILDEHIKAEEESKREADVKSQLAKIQQNLKSKAT